MKIEYIQHVLELDDLALESYTSLLNLVLPTTCKSSSFALDLNQARYLGYISTLSCASK